MRITSIIKNVQRETISTSKRVSSAINKGYSIGKRTSDIQKSNTVPKWYGISKSVSRQVLKITSINDLPIIAGGVGLLLPVPLSSPIMLVTGKIIQLAYKAFKRMPA